MASEKDKDLLTLLQELQVGTIIKVDENSYKCTVCLCNISGETQAVDHANGSKHYKRKRTISPCDRKGIDSNHPLTPSFPILRPEKLSKQETDSSENNSNISKNFYCIDCKISVTGKVPWEQHIAGKSHFKAAKKSESMTSRSSSVSLEDQSKDYKISLDSNGSFHCSVCNIDVTGDAPWKQHIAGKSHLRAVSVSGRASSRGSSVSIEDQPIDSKISLNSSDNFHCQDCNINVNGAAPWQQHLAGKSHLKAVRNTNSSTGTQSVDTLLPKGGKVDSKVEASHYCSLCNKFFTGVIPYDMHLASKGHLKKKVFAYRNSSEIRSSGSSRSGSSTPSLPSHQSSPSSPAELNSASPSNNDSDSSDADSPILNISKRLRQKMANPKPVRVDCNFFVVETWEPIPLIFQ